MSAHTPGPWQLHAEGSVRVCDGAHDTEDGCRALADAEILQMPRAEAEANARLIAAAPELLDDATQNDRAFTWLAEQMNSLTDNAKHWNVAQIEALAQDLRVGIERNQKRTRAAIAKAEGRS